MAKTRARKKIGLSTESAVDLMQEIYTEIVDERNKAIQNYKRFMRDIEEIDEIASVGRITNDLLKVVDSAIEKKIRLLKIQTDILYKTNKGADKGEKDYQMSEEDSAFIHEELKKELKDIKNTHNDPLEYD